MMLRELQEMIGREHPLADVPAALERAVREIGAPVTGAYLITCSDESEKEARIAFYHGLVRRLLPELKFSRRSAFKTTNLGARYERGALAIAEDHFATPASMDAFKVLVVKLSSHVSIDKPDRDGSHVYGRMDRYDRESIFCGAINALLDGVELPAIDDLRRTFSAGGLDRLALLADPEVVAPRLRPLAAAIVNARLQTAQIIADLEARTPTSPTVYLVASCVSFNRLDADTELFCGLATADSREPTIRASYTGLGDDPRRYRFDEGHRLAVTS